MLMDLVRMQPDLPSHDPVWIRIRQDPRLDPAGSRFCTEMFPSMMLIRQDPRLDPAGSRFCTEMFPSMMLNIRGFLAFNI